MAPRSAVALTVGLWALLPLRAATAQAPATDPVPILERAAAAYQALTSLRASFHQTVANEMIGTFQSSGELAQTGPAHFSMRFSDPAGEAIVLDGSHLWLYTPSTTPGQVIRSRLPQNPTYGFNVLAWLLDRPAQRYHARYLRGDVMDGQPVDVLELTPRDPGLPFTAAVVWLDHGNALPRRVELTELSGTRRTLTLSRLRPNAAIPAGTFTFRVPNGVRVVDQ